MTTIQSEKARVDKPKLSWGLRGPVDLPVQAADLPMTPAEAWGGSTGRGVRVCVVDSGVEANHPDVGELHGSYVVSGPDDEVVAHGELPPVRNVVVERFGQRQRQQHACDARHVHHIAKGGPRRNRRPSRDLSRPPGARLARPLA